MTAPPTTTAPPSAPERSATRGRLVGVDLARCLALLGMMATHVLPSLEGDGVREPWSVPLVQQVAGGRSSALFAVLAGLSLVLVSGTRGPVRGRAWLGLQAGTVVRAVLVALVGFQLATLETGIAVILVCYAVLFVVSAPFLWLRTSWLAVAAAVSAVVGPPLGLLLRRDLPPPSYEVPAWDALQAPGDLLRELLLTGYYPVATWLPYLLVGMVLGRLDLRSAAVAGRVAAAGLGAMLLAWVSAYLWLAQPGVRGDLRRSAVGPDGTLGWLGDLDATLTHGLYGVVPTGSWSWLGVTAPHSGAWGDLLTTTGSAALVLGLCLLVCRPPLVARVVGVLAGAGAMTLTLYTLHVVLRQEGWWDGDEVSDYLGQVALVLIIGAGFRLARRRGPLEAVVGVASSAARRSVGGPR